MKAKVMLFLFLFLMGTPVLFAQTISESDVPQDVFISFKYKYPDAVISSWESSGGNFVAKFKLSDQEGKAEFTANGKWVATRFSIAEKELPSPIVSYFKDNYRVKDYSLTSSELVKDGTGETFYYLQTKKSGFNQAKAIELFFDLNGTFLRKIEPVETNADNSNNGNNNTNVGTLQTENPKDTVAPNTDFTKKELPTSVNNYIKANFPSHTIKDSKFYKDETMGEVYYILLKEQGFKEQVELYFDIYGALLKKIDSREARANQVQKNDNSSTKPDVTQPNPEEVKKKNEGEPVVDTKVPALAKSHFLSKNKKAVDISWFKLDKTFIAHYTLGGRKGLATYNEEGAWKETRLDVDPDALSALILTFLKDNFRKYKTVKAEYVLTAPKFKFYEVQIVEKSSKDPNPPVTKVFFDGNGKYSSIEKPDVADNNDEAKQKEEEEKAFLDQVDASNQKIETGTGVNDVVNPKELPTDAVDFIKKTYPELKIKESRYLFDDDLNAHVYYVTVKKEGDKYEIELFFDLAGKLLKKIDPTEKKYNGDNSVKEEVVVEEGMPLGSEKIDPKNLPSGIKSYLNKNYPDQKVEQSVYTTDEEFGNVYYLLLKKSGSKTNTELWFDLNGKLVKSGQSN